MTGSDHAPGYVPNPDYTQEDWDAVSDNPEMTDEEIARLRLADEVLPPEMLAKLRARRPRGPQKAPTKELLTLRLDRDVVTAFRTSGPGWQSRINEALRKAVGLKPD